MLADVTHHDRRHLAEITAPPGTRPWTLSLAVLAGRYLDRGLIEVASRMDGTRPFVLTAAGRAAMEGA